jgi:hypothetical protein
MGNFRNPLWDYLFQKRLVDAVGQPETAPILREPTATQRYIQAIGDYPKYEDYKPSTFRRISGALAGISGVPGAQRAVEDAPYYRSLIPYQQRMGALKTGSDIEMAQAKAAAENFRERMLARQAQEQAGKYGEEAETERFQRTPGYYESEERLKRAGLGYRGAAFPVQGKYGALSPEGEFTVHDVGPPDIRQIEAAKTRAGAQVTSAKELAAARRYAAEQSRKAREFAATRIAARRGSTKFMTPAEQSVASQVAAQNVKNLAGQTIIDSNGISRVVPENVDDYLEVDGSEVKLKSPTAWWGEPDPEEMAEFEIVKMLFERAFEETKGQAYGLGKDEDMDEWDLINED